MSGGAAGATPSPRLRATPEDFLVDEVAAFAPSGEGSHTFVRIEKRLRTTTEVARDLARAAGVAARDVGFAGRKDRVAVTRQWFSLPGVDPERALSFDLPGVRVLEAARHPHKLRTGHLRANRFELRVRDAPPNLVVRARERLAVLERLGLPNRFGPQRFGREGDNAVRGAALLRGELELRDRRAARFLVSALQAEVFNEVLRRRPLPLDRVACGDVARVAASGGLFVVEDVARENERAGRFEISATGPIFGTRVHKPEGSVALREASVLAAFDIPDPEDMVPPRGVRLRGTRRPLRVPLEAVSLDEDREGVRLCVTLPAGSYASVLLHELFGPLAEGPPARDDGAAASRYAGGPGRESR